MFLSSIFSLFLPFSLCPRVIFTYLSVDSHWCVFGSTSTLKEQFDGERAALQRSIHKNSALTAEKEQLVQNLRSEVGTSRITAVAAAGFLRRNLKKVCFPHSWRSCTAKVLRSDPCRVPFRPWSRTRRPWRSVLRGWRRSWLQPKTHSSCPLVNDEALRMCTPSRAFTSTTPFTPVIQVMRR